MSKSALFLPLSPLSKLERGRGVRLLKNMCKKTHLLTFDVFYFKLFLMPVATIVPLPAVASLKLGAFLSG